MLRRIASIKPKWNCQGVRWGSSSSQSGFMKGGPIGGRLHGGHNSAGQCQQVRAGQICLIVEGHRPHHLACLVFFFNEKVGIISAMRQCNGRHGISLAYSFDTVNNQVLTSSRPGHTLIINYPLHCTQKSCFSIYLYVFTLAKLTRSKDSNQCVLMMSCSTLMK